MKRHTPLVALLLVNAIACIGTRVSAIAIPWFVLVTTGSATQTGLVAACELAPYVIVKALAGPITDRLGQRRVSIVADLASMIIIGLIPIAHLLGELSLPALLIMVAIGGGLRGPGDNAKHTTIPLVAEAAGAPLERVTGLYGAIERGSGLVAPAIAAIMINSVSAVGAIAVTAGCFGLSAVVVWLGLPRTLNVARQQTPRPSPIWPGCAPDGRFLVKDRLLFTLVCMIMITNLLDVAKTTVLLPVWAHDGGHGVTSISVFLTCMAACSVVSSLLASWLGARLPRRLTYFAAFAIAGPPPFLALALDLPVWSHRGDLRHRRVRLGLPQSDARRDLLRADSAAVAGPGRRPGRRHRLGRDALRRAARGGGDRHGRAEPHVRDLRDRVRAGHPAAGVRLGRPLVRPPGGRPEPPKVSVGWTRSTDGDRVRTVAD